jgi:hypothetical protein
MIVEDFRECNPITHKLAEYKHGKYAGGEDRSTSIAGNTKDAHNRRRMGRYSSEVLTTSITKNRNEDDYSLKPPPPIEKRVYNHDDDSKYPLEGEHRQKVVKHHHHHHHHSSSHHPSPHRGLKHHYSSTQEGMIASQKQNLAKQIGKGRDSSCLLREYCLDRTPSNILLIGIYGPRRFD